jgi:hypothetical protein
MSVTAAMWSQSLGLGFALLIVILQSMALADSLSRRTNTRGNKRLGRNKKMHLDLRGLVRHDWHIRVERMQRVTQPSENPWPAHLEKVRSAAEKSVSWDFEGEQFNSKRTPRL